MTTVAGVLNFGRSLLHGWLIVLAFRAAAASADAASVDAELAARVVLLTNSADPDSVRIARHYAEVRHVPPANIVALKMPLAETISWPEFVSGIWAPLLAQLVREKWIDAIPMALTDPVGRQKYAANSHRISALVVCRGVPLRIAHDASLFATAAASGGRARFPTNAGAVDSELSLLGFPSYPINGYVSNPLFQNERPTPLQLSQVVKVSRLDGPTVDHALALVDRAMAAERAGLLGRAYVDLSDFAPAGNAWLESVAAQIAELGFDLSVDRNPVTMPATARIDAPVLYFGWYAGELNGPFALPGFHFPPGAIAVHIHSFSATTLRSASVGWTGPLIARGVAATVGNVYEPYLEFTHRPDLLVRQLARGATLVDAAYFSLPALSWQAVLIGDPLYRPFAVALDEQMRNFGRLPPRLAGYAVLRRMHQLDAAGAHDEATQIAVTAQRDAPCLAVGLALAQRLREKGDTQTAAETLDFALLLKSLPPDEWALARDAAQVLEALGHLDRALVIWRTLLAEKQLPAALRTPWLGEAHKTALAAKDSAQAAAWEKQAGQRP